MRESPDITVTVEHTHGSLAQVEEKVRQAMERGIPASSSAARALASSEAG